jgi:phosphoglycerol transferase MdoB-like AlkP superfamily enzyme
VTSKHFVQYFKPNKMMSFTRRMSSAVLAKRAFSSVSPKVAIGQNILRLDAIFNAADEAALTKAAAAPLPSVDPNNLPVQLKSLSGWYALDSVSAGDKFVPNPNAWQNKNFWEYAADEAKRPETWPFIVGFM